ncbi:unnamed protein product [Cochlearia groenlandica]
MKTSLIDEKGKERTQPFGSELALIPHDILLAKETTLDEGEFVSRVDKGRMVIAVMVKTQEQRLVEREQRMWRRNGGGRGRDDDGNLAGGDVLAKGMQISK